MAKMYASTIIEGVEIFKDFNHKEKYDGVLNGFNVEFIGRKARVICTSPYVAKEDNTSRLNKLSPMGSCRGGLTPDTFNYELIVNGIKVYFSVEHNIFQDEK
jgi:hypothetical protein